MAGVYENVGQEGQVTVSTRPLEEMSLIQGRFRRVTRLRFVVKTARVLVDRRMYDTTRPPVSKDDGVCRKRSTPSKAWV